MATTSFGKYLRKRRLALLAKDGNYSLRRVARASGLEPSFLSKIERDVAPPPSERKIKALARAIGEVPDILLALAGKISTDLQEVILKRPRLFAELLRILRRAPDGHVSGMIREARAKYGTEKVFFGGG